MRVTASSVYDDNLFWRPVGTGDFMWRLTPEIDARHRTTKLTLTGSYGFDAEQFRDRAELSTLAARQRATLGATIRPTPFTTLVFDSGYAQTTTAGELNVATGLSTDRQPAREWRGGAAVRRALGPQTVLQLGYKLSEQLVLQGDNVATHTVDVWWSRRASVRDETYVRYTGRRFVLDAANAIPSDSAVVGWKRRVGDRINAVLEGGPLLTRQSLRPEILASIGHQAGSQTASMSYAVTQTTAVGVSDVIAVQRAQLELAHRSKVGRKAALRGAFFLNTVGVSAVRVFQLSATITQPINDKLAFSVDYARTIQQGQLGALTQTDLVLRRNVVSARLTVFSGSSR
jgi:hypothetical protein